LSSINDILSSFRDGHHEFENGNLTGFEGSNPYDLFEEWTKNAVDNNESEPNAFVLSTVDAHHQPSSRIVYLKDVIERKLVFYTNYSSHKGSDLLVNSQVSMLFFWPNSLRQVRVQGICSKVPAEISDAYFNSRPRGSQIGASNLIVEKR
jgi:pyridoxamine 5'-phosphate oxidase